jgi:hypothetical protein
VPRQPHAHDRIASEVRDRIERGEYLPGPNTKMVRKTVDLTSTVHRDLNRRLQEAATDLDRSRVTTQMYLSNLIAIATQDDKVHEMVLDRIGGPPGAEAMSEVHEAELVHSRSMTGSSPADDHEALACGVHACRVAVPDEAVAVRCRPAGWLGGEVAAGGGRVLAVQLVESGRVKGDSAVAPRCYAAELGGW